jgi:hypothetical protein
VQELGGTCRAAAATGLTPAEVNRLLSGRQEPSPRQREALEAAWKRWRQGDTPPNHPRGREALSGPLTVAAAERVLREEYALPEQSLRTWRRWLTPLGAQVLELCREEAILFVPGVGRASLLLDDLYLRQEPWFLPQHPPEEGGPPVCWDD